MKETTKNLIKGTLRLKNPILINGNEITEVSYDSNEIDGILFATAESKRKAAAGRKDISIAPAAEFDFSLHLYLGLAAIAAVNPSYDFSDLERIKGHDVVEVMSIGRNFMLASGEKESQESDSGEPTGIMHEPTIPACQTSKKSE